MALVLVRARVRRDILGTADYLREQGGEELAQRFIDAAKDTFEALARMPKSGVLCGFSMPSSNQLRRWPIKGLENWLAFYLARRNGVEIVHVVHRSRDIENILNG